MDLNQKKFRPQNLGARKRKQESLGKYNWQKKYPWSLKNYLQHVFSVLHYKSCHAPQPIQIKWKGLAFKFSKKHKNIV